MQIFPVVPDSPACNKKGASVCPVAPSFDVCLISLKLVDVRMLRNQRAFTEELDSRKERVLALNTH